MLRLFEAFSGIGAFHRGFKDFIKLVGFSEIDLHAIKSYCTMHNVSPSLNYGDISKVPLDKLPKFDVFTFSFPCTDISKLGKQKGLIDEYGDITRSGLYYAGLKVLKHSRPKVCIIENVQNLTSRKFRDVFLTILGDLVALGYTNYYENLNVKDYGLPQNRERVFIVSILGEHESFKFESGIPLKVTLEDILESNVSKEYFLSRDKTEKILKDLGDIKVDCPKALTEVRSVDAKILRKMYNREYGKDYCPRRGKVFSVRPDNLSNCLTATISNEHLILLESNHDYTNHDYIKYMVRRLTPKEFWLLQGFTSLDIDKCTLEGVSKGQLYKQAGNSIGVPVVEMIGRQLLKSLARDI